MTHIHRLAVPLFLVTACTPELEHDNPLTPSPGDVEDGGTDAAMEPTPAPDGDDGGPAPGPDDDAADDPTDDDATDDSDDPTDNDPTDDDPPATQICPNFLETFDNPIGTMWSRHYPTRLEQRDGQMYFTVSATADDENVQLLVTPDAESLAGMAVKLRTGVVPAHHGVQLHLRVVGQDGNWLNYTLQNVGGNLTKQVRMSVDGTVQPVLVVDNHDPTVNGWMQIREEDGTIYIETSSNGVTFDEFISFPTPFDLTNVQVGVSAQNWAVLEEDVEVSVREFALDCGDVSMPPG